MRRTWGIIATVLGILGLLWVVLVAAPPWFVHDRSLEGLKAQNEVRTTLLQGLGGVVLLVGAYFTYRQVTNSRAQLQVAQQGQITERFTRAIDQLGHAQLDVRLGGIYALERIARDSAADRTTIGEVLTAFVRSHAPWPPRLPGQYVSAAPIGDVPELQVRAADVQACLTVLGRGGFAPPAEAEGDWLDLHAVDLRRANLRGAHLERATLGDAHLEGATLNDAHFEQPWLRGARMEGARLLGAHLEQADLADAHLEQANLHGTRLEGADLHGTRLEGADLYGARLEGADLYGARLEGAILADAHLEQARLDDAHLERALLLGAHLEGADLDGAHLEGTQADERTVWPEEFDLRVAGVIVAGEGD
jgi:uncharacterized protein YjbI with pentapeptide repeats